MELLVAFLPSITLGAVLVVIAEGARDRRARDARLVKAGWDAAFEFIGAVAPSIDFGSARERD